MAAEPNTQPTVPVAASSSTDASASNSPSNPKKPHRHHCSDHHDHSHSHAHAHSSDEEDEEEEVKLNLSDFHFKDQKELSLLHHHLRSLPDLTSPTFTSLENLNLRQNLLTSLDGIGCLSNLKRLDLYLNSFDVIPSQISTLPNLTWLDFSFNNIRVIQNIDALRSLKQLYLVNNKIKKMQNLSALTELQLLELGSNRIRVIEGLSQNTHIRELWLGKNKIRELKGLDTLTSLRLLSIQSNRLTQIGEGLQFNVRLEELYLSHNGLQSLDEGLKCLVNLKTLDVAGNFITKIENLEGMAKLRELWMNDNKVDGWEGLESITSTVIETIYLERNPIQLADEEAYRTRLLGAFASLKQLDATPLVGRQRADKIEARMQYKVHASDEKPKGILKK